MTKPKRYKRFSSESKREAIMHASEKGMTDENEPAYAGERRALGLP